MTKTCTKCSKSKPANVKNFRPDSRMKSGWACWCRACYNAYQREAAARVKLDPVKREAKNAKARRKYAELAGERGLKQRARAVVRPGMMACTLAEIAKDMDITVERVRQIEARAIFKLRRYMKQHPADTALLQGLLVEAQRVSDRMQLDGDYSFGN